MQFRKSLITAALALALQAPVTGMAADAIQMPAMGDWSKGMGEMCIRDRSWSQRGA